MNKFRQEGIMKRSCVCFLFVLFFSQLFFAQTWSAPKRLTWNSGGSVVPVITVDSGNIIHVVWEDNSPGNNELFYKFSTDGGSNWSAIRRLTWNAGWSMYPSIAADKNTGIHVVWEDSTSGNSEIFYKYSIDSGATWSTLKRLTWNPGSSSDVSITTDMVNGIHVVWQDYTPMNHEIFYKRSTDSGATWSGLTQLTWNLAESSNPSITADSENGIHVVWHDNTPGNYEIYYKHSTDNGITWSGPKRLTWNKGNSFGPSITSDPNNRIHIVWQDVTFGNYDIFHKYSTDNGNSWSLLKRLTWNRINLNEPAITSDLNNGIHIAWHDKTLGNDEIFYRNSTNSGVLWSKLTRVTWSGNGSWDPSIDADMSNGIHLVWYANTPGDSEIFYKNRK